jgi:hypothetical protein
MPVSAYDGLSIFHGTVRFEDHACCTIGLRRTTGILVEDPSGSAASSETVDLYRQEAALPLPWPKFRVPNKNDPVVVVVVVVVVVFVDPFRVDFDGDDNIVDRFFTVEIIRWVVVVVEL